MRLLAIIFLIGGVALAGGAIFFAKEHFRNVEAMLAGQQEEGPETVLVVAAKVPLKYGDRLTYDVGREVLRFVEWPKTAVPPNAFLSADDLFGEEKSETRTVTRAIEPGELILKSKVTGFGESVRVATQVREGMRAVTIPINAVTGAAGLISPGDRVDIIYVRHTGGDMSSHILLQDVLVVATDQVTDTEYNRAKVARTATVEVNPTDAQRLTLALQTGQLSLLLRGVNEVVTSGETIESVDLSSLPGAAKEPEPEAPAPVVVEEDTGYRVKVRKGASETVINFE